LKPVACILLFFLFDFVDIKIAYQILVRKRERKRPLWRFKHRFEGGIKMDVEDVGYWEMNWIGSSTGLSDFIKARVTCPAK
jgi:hypothetical protein